ncbi:MAG: helix-turn-helix domain-containing protein [Clostridia bacterium]|nr:helix-turn-helix domain-containing protein [Clostridia bacterium]
MSRFSENLRRIRFERHMTQEEFADLLGTKKQNISRYESGAVSPKISTAEVMAAKLGMTLSELNGSEESLGKLPSNVRPISSLHRQRVPLIGSVAAGQPIYDPEDLGVYVESPVDADAAITILGDSMTPTYLEGDVVYIKCCPDVHEGSVAVVFLDDEATIKHVYKRPTGLTLWSDNTVYPPMNIEFDDYNVVRIFGVPVGYTRIYKPSIEGKIKKGF